MQISAEQFTLVTVIAPRGTADAELAKLGAEKLVGAACVLIADANKGDKREFIYKALKG